MNRLSEGPVIVGDILFDSGKLSKAIKIRIGSGGVAIGSSATVVVNPFLSRASRMQMAMLP